MALVEATARWGFDVFMWAVGGITALIMALIGKIWKTQDRKIDSLEVKVDNNRSFYVSELKDLREDVDDKHADNRRDMRDLRAVIDTNDKSAQERHDEIMRHLRDRRNGPPLKDRY